MMNAHRMISSEVIRIHDRFVGTPKEYRWTVRLAVAERVVSPENQFFSERSPSGRMEDNNRHSVLLFFVNLKDAHCLHGGKRFS